LNKRKCIQKQSNDPWLFGLDWKRREIKINKKTASLEHENVYLDAPSQNNLFFKILCEKDQIKVEKNKLLASLFIKKIKQLKVWFNKVNGHLEKILEMDNPTSQVFSTAKYLPKNNQHLLNYPE